MSEQNPTNAIAGKTGASHAGRKISCEEWEALLVDFLDGAMPPGETAAFEAHPEGCTACTDMFEKAGQGREWLKFLRVEPEAPSVLVTNILARTSGSAVHAGLEGELLPAAVVAIPIMPALPFWKRNSAALANRVAQPRLLMTAAMAFFSITLTLNMAGVRLSTVRLADLRPASLSNNLENQFWKAGAGVIRYYDNVRFIYVMEAQVKELRRNADLETTSPADKPEQPAPAGTSQDGGHKNGGKSQAPSSSSEPQPFLWGEKIEATLRNPVGELPAALAEDREREQQNVESNTENTDSRAADRVERGIA